MNTPLSNQLNTQDRLDIQEKISLYGHLLDDGLYSHLSDIFTEDSIFDLTGYGGGVYSGLPAIINLMQTSTEHPVAHHASNVVISKLDDDSARVQSKGLGVGRKGRVGSVSYHDIFVRTSAGWRISQREVLLRGLSHHSD